MATRSILLALVLVTAGCATTADIDTDYDPAANFSGYRTYSWIIRDVPQGMNPLAFERVRASINRSLAARSFTESPQGDFAIAFTIGARDRVEVNDYGPYGAYYPGWGRGYRFGWAPIYNDVDIRNVTDGTLAIDIYDASTKKPVWHGTATKEVGSGQQVPQAELDAAVDQLLAKFPPSAGQ